MLNCPKQTARFSTGGKPPRLVLASFPPRESTVEKTNDSGNKSTDSQDKQEQKTESTSF